MKPLSSPSSPPSRDALGIASEPTALQGREQGKDPAWTEDGSYSVRSLRPPASLVTNGGADTGEHDVANVPPRGAVLDGKYRIESVIGQGGMAVVVGAMHLHLDERVAIKLMLPEWAEDPELVERFMHEGRAATKIRSEHVVRVHDVGLMSDRPYLVMEYLAGSDLDQLVSTVGPLPVRTAIEYLLQACEAIAEAHAVGIIHRDLKPANLFLTHRVDGTACIKVLDFGISKRLSRGARGGARETSPSMILGSPHYMSPEQMQGARTVDERADIWALGAILHELLTGAPPFHGDTMTALCAKIMSEKAPPLSALRPDVPAAVEAVVLRCLEKDPRRRFSNVAELAVALAALGSEAAHASAVRIGRVLNVAVADTRPAARAMAPVPSSRTTPPSRRMTPNAVELLDAATASSRRSSGRAFGYFVFALVLLSVGAGVGWMTVNRERALHDAERAANEAAANATALTPAAPQAETPHVEPPSTALGTTATSLTTLTSAATLSGAPAADAGATSDAAPLQAATPTEAHRPHHAPRAESTPPSIVPAPSPVYVPSVRANDDPSFASPKPPPVSTASAPPTTPTDADGLFDDRK